MRNLPGNALLLIGIMPTIKDLEIARVLGWYRIPMKSSPKVIDVDYLAFYQGANFGDEHRWQIEFLAAYRGHELTTRGELLREQPDHPRAKEEYYKVQLGPLIQLETPIKAEAWKRITFLYTTGEMFNQAAIINDLVVRTEEREILWKNLRERSQNPSLYKTEQPDDAVISAEMLNLILGLNDGIPNHDLEDY